MGLNEKLALADACLTAASIACMIPAYRAIRQKDVATHKRLMLAAAGFSAVFLAIFCVRFYWFGMTPFRRESLPLKILFYVLYFTHEPLAVVNVALVGAALLLALSRSFEMHREVARIAFPIWLYVAATGIIIWAMLYL